MEYSAALKEKEKSTSKPVNVIVFTLAHFTHDFYAGMLAPLLPALIEKLSLLNTQAGFLVVFLQWPSLLQPLIGRVADKKDLKFWITAGPAVTGFFMSLLGIAPDYITLAFFLILAGISSAGFHAIGPALLGRRSGHHIGKNLAFWMVAGEVGFMAGPIAAVSLVSLYSLNRTPWLMLIGLGMSVVFHLYFQRFDSEMPSSKDGTNKTTDLKSLLLVFIPLAGMILARAFLRAGSETFLPVYLTQRGASLWLAGAGVTILMGAGAAGSLSGGALQSRIGIKPLLLTSVVASAIFTVLLTLTSGVAQLLVIILLGFSSMLFLPVALVYVQNKFPQNRSFVSGLYQASMFLSQSAAAIIFGRMLDTIGSQSAYLITAGICLISIPCILALPR